MKFTKLIVIAAAVLALLMVPMSMGARPAAAQVTYTNCFPSCDGTDGKFAVIASGSGYSTLAREPLSFFITTTQPQLDFGIFDPDISGLWDYFGSQPGNVDFRLYVDPFRSGNPGSGQIGAWSSTSLAGSDNAWFNISINPNNPFAFNGTEYVYLLVIDQTDATAISLNPFKVGVGSGDGLELVPDVTFGFIGAAAKEADLAVLYPNWSSLSLDPTTYDGEWTFNLNVPAPPSGPLDEVSLWDGDLDYGDGTVLDTDDVDTGNIKPGFNNSPDAVAQGAQGVGAPKENNGFLFQGLPVFLRGNPITYELVDPNGVHYVNSNPSGNREWEQFRIRTDTNPNGCDADGVADGNALDDTDACVTSLTPGTWQLHVMGVDLTNLNFFRFSYGALGGASSPELSGYVYEDANQNGTFDTATESGLGGVQVSLSGTDVFNHSVNRVTTTDSTGFYGFTDLPPGTYTVVETDPPNYVSVAANPGSTGGTATDANTLSNIPLPVSLDSLNNNFGDVQGGTIGDYVWSDTNADGIQNDGDQAGINGVVIDLLDSNGDVVATTTTANNPTTVLPGWYEFTTVAPGAYTVEVADSNFNPGSALEGLAPTLAWVGGDRAVDSNGSPTSTTLDPGETDNTVDFGYAACGACGGKVTTLALRYNGTTSNANVQVIQKNGDVVFDSTVQPGETFTFSGTDNGTLGTEITIKVNGVENTKIHTSCSQDIGPGMTFGDFEVISAVSKDGGLICPLPPPEVEFCEEYNLDVRFGDTFNIRDYVHVKDGSQPVDWSQVFFTYTEVGANDPTNPEDWHLADFNAGLSVTVSAADAEPGTGNHGDGEYRVYVYRQGQTTYDDHMTIRVSNDHDSEVEEAKCAPGGGSCGASSVELKFKDEEVKWKIKNTGSGKITIDSITISWPGDPNGELEEVKLGKKKIFDQDQDPPSTTIGSGWIGGIKDRQIDPNKEKELKFKFEHDVSTDAADYSIKVVFAEGCELEFTPGSLPFTCNKPIDSLTMIWDGIQPSSLQPVGVKAWKGAPGSTLLDSVDPVNLGDALTVSDYAGSPNDVIWEIFQSGTNFGTKLGESMFHLSCSDPDMDGPEDCGKRQGDGKQNNAGKINDWLLEGMVDSQSTLACTP